MAGKDWPAPSLNLLNEDQATAGIAGLALAVHHTTRPVPAARSACRSCSATVLNATIVTQILIWGSKPASKSSPAARRAREAAAKAAAEETKKAK